MTMHFKSRMLALALLFCAPGAFAAETVSVDIPFSFESGGKHFQPSQYDVRLDEDRRLLTLTSRQTPSKQLSLLAEPTDSDRHATALTIRFESAGGVLALRVIRLGSYEAHLTSR
jgi:hypothetical protein